MPNEKHGQDFGTVADSTTQLVRAEAVIGVAGNTTDVLDTVGYDWVDWMVRFDDGSGAITKVTFTPFSIAPDATGTLRQFNLPYEPPVAGVGLTVVYPWQWEFAVSAGATDDWQVFRTPVLGPAMQLFMAADADDIEITIWAFRRKDGGPKAR